MIHVLATIRVDPQRRGEFLKAFSQLVPVVLQEQGCLEYGAAVDEPTDIDGQVLAGQDAVVVVEKWESTAALKAHLAAPHMAAFREANASILRGLSLQVLSPA
ncbi:MAG: antibiotic biosynthesis monooxygenase [Planctomycetales bacterium]|nr:antibiotic biosynthesis monooxygenase [Planctomycetales bacterium]